MDDVLESAVDRIFDGYSILFLGSGFSAYARNSNNKELPTGGHLNRLLKEASGIGAEYPLDIVSREYILKFGEHKLFELLNERLSAQSISNSQKQIISLPWRRIYTTNYDNVIELCGSELGKKIEPATLRDKADHSRTATQCVHLNGRLAAVSITNFLQEIKLTRASYLTDTFLNTGWHATFRNDLALATSVFFIGYSMYDIDVARILYEDPMLKEKTFFVDASDLDPILERELAQYGLVFPVGLDLFANSTRVENPSREPKRPFSSFERFELPTKAQVAEGDDVLSLLIRGEIKDELIPAPPVNSPRYIVRRSGVEAVIQQIEKGGNRFLIHGDLGNGKTALLHMLRIRLAQLNYSVLTLKQNFDAAENDIRLISAATKPDIVIIEDIYRNSEVVKKLCFAAPKAVVIATSRTSVFDLRNSEAEDLFQSEFFEHDINSLDTRERTELIALANENGLWGELSSKSGTIKDDFVRSKCGNEIRSFLTYLLESPSFKERIRSSFYSAAEEDVLICIALILFLDVANFDPDLFVVSQLSNIDFLKVAKLKNNSIAREYLEFRSGKVRVKSAVLAQFILREIFDYDLSLRYLIRAIHACESARPQNKFFGDIQKEFMKFSFIDRIFSRTKDSGHYVKFYDAMKTLPSMARNPQFWLQYAIARLEHSQFNSADTLFRTAYSHARSIAGYNPFQIDNHYARYLLVSRTSDPRYEDYFKAFIDAHQLLIKQAHTEPNAYYPYKVARLYKPFVQQNLKRMTPEQLAVISGAAKQMISQINKSSRHVTRYRLVTECMQDLEETQRLLST